MLTQNSAGFFTHTALQTNVIQYCTASCYKIHALNVANLSTKDMDT